MDKFKGVEFITASDKLANFIQNNPQILKDLAYINQKTNKPDYSSTERIKIEIYYDSSTKKDTFYPDLKALGEAADKWLEKTNESNTINFEIRQELKLETPKPSKPTISREQLIEKIRDYLQEQKISADKFEEKLDKILALKPQLFEASRVVYNRLQALKTKVTNSVGELDPEMISPGFLAAIILDESLRADDDDVDQDKFAKELSTKNEIKKDTQWSKFIFASKRLSDCSLGLGRVKPNTYLDLVESDYLEAPIGYQKPVKNQQTDKLEHPDINYQIAAMQILDESKVPEVVSAYLSRIYNRVILGKSESFSAQDIQNVNLSYGAKRRHISALYSQGMNSKQASIGSRQIGIGQLSIFMDSYFSV